MTSRDRHAAGWRLGATAALLSVGLAAAATEDEHREHGAHEHGHGSIEVAVEGDELVIGLRIRSRKQPEV